MTTFVHAAIFGHVILLRMVSWKFENSAVWKFRVIKIKGYKFTSIFIKDFFLNLRISMRGMKKILRLEIITI